MGGSAALHEWKSRNVWRVVRRSNADACGNHAAAALNGDLPDGDCVELSRKLDVPGRSVRTVVQPIVDFGACGEYGNAAVERIEDGNRRQEHAAADRVSGDEDGCERARAVLPRLASASEFRRLLEAVVD